MDSFDDLLSICSISNGPPKYVTTTFGSFLTRTAELAGIDQNDGPN